MNALAFAERHSQLARKPRGSLTPSERAQMVKHWLEGVPAVRLAKKHKVHPSYVRVAARRAGFLKRSGRAA